VVESPTQFACERALKREEPGAEAQAPNGCGFVLPRTVCKREITREEAQVYVRMGKTELLSDFTSRFGRPFAATLVLKETGRHGFEFQPREGRSRASAGRKKATRKKATRKKATRKKKAATRKKTSQTSRKASRKTASTRKKAAAKKATTRKKSPRKKSAARTRGDG
jgi:DNA topoisomerase-3